MAKGEESKTFCVYPWMHQVVLPPGTVGFCCVAKDGGPVMGSDGKSMKVPGVRLSEAWNSDYQKSIRQKMLNGEKVAGCNLCYYQESIQKKSYRQMHNEEWLGKDRGEVQRRIEASKHNGFRVEAGPTYLDLRLGNLCNLKCRMCNPYNSTKIASETEKLLTDSPDFAQVYSKYYGDKVYKIPKWFEDPGFWEDIYKQLPSLRKVYLTGGEPTLIKQNYEFLKKCVETGHSKHIFLMFNINCTYLTDEFMSYLKHFEFVLINASIDGVGETNNYIRGASDWKVVEENFTKLLKIPGNIKVGITPTIQIYNVLNIPELLEFVFYTEGQTGSQINVDFLYVTDPPFLDIRHLPASIKRQAIDKIESFKEKFSFQRAGANTHQLVDSLINALNPDRPGEAEKLQEFVKYTRALDLSRKESFAYSLPQISQALQAQGISL